MAEKLSLASWALSTQECELCQSAGPSFPEVAQQAVCLSRGLLAHTELRVPQNPDVPCHRAAA